MALDLTPYSTAKPMLGVLPTWLPAEDAERLASYALYEAMYRNVPDAFTVTQRGSDQSPIYVPNAKTLIEATNRFLCPSWNFAMDPKLGTDADRALVSGVLTQLFRREQLRSKFSSQKRYGLIRGDAVWYITADEEKPEGRRVSIHEIDPAEYFPIEDEDDDRLIGCHLVSQFETVDGETVIRRQTYRKNEDSTISYELSWWELGAWDDRFNSGQELKKVPTPEGQEAVVFDLPPSITALPVYLVRNNRVPGAPFGSSELQGLERIFAAVNQAVSDEELALAMDGLGMYATTSGPPVNDDGEETNWELGPGYVVEIDEGATWERVDGVGSVQPVQDHVTYLEDRAFESAGVPKIARGLVDTSITQSGVALAFHMGPLLAKNEEKQDEILSTIDHILYDLSTMWLPTYEGLPTGTGAQAVSTVGDPLPLDRNAVLTEITTLLTNNLISIPYAQQLVSEKLGYDFPAEMLEQIVLEQTELAKARNADPFADRIGRELEDGAGA